MAQVFSIFWQLIYQDTPLFACLAFGVPNMRRAKRRFFFFSSSRSHCRYTLIKLLAIRLLKAQPIIYICTVSVTNTTNSRELDSLVMKSWATNLRNRSVMLERIRDSLFDMGPGKSRRLQKFLKSELMILGRCLRRRTCLICLGGQCWKRWS